MPSAVHDDLSRDSIVQGPYIRPLPLNNSSFSHFDVTTASFRVCSSLPHRCAVLLMADQVPVVPDVHQLQDALAVLSAKAGATQAAQNADGAELPAVVAQVVALPAPPFPEQIADVVGSSLPSVDLPRFSLYFLASFFFLLW